MDLLVLKRISKCCIKQGMKRAIIIHGWKEEPTGQWLPWLGESLQNLGWDVELPAMPGQSFPELNVWMNILASLKPDKNTLLIGHSLANSLIMKYLEKADTEILGAILVAAWDWLMEDVKDEHKTFFENGFNYKTIKSKNVKKFIINSTNDPWIDIDRSRPLADKIGANFISIKNAGHFMARDGYADFPQLLEVIKNEF